MVLSFGESIERVADAERCIVEVMRIVSGLDEMKILRQARKLPQYVSATVFIFSVAFYISCKLPECKSYSRKLPFQFVPGF